jgi:hypothetical protein
MDLTALGVSSDGTSRDATPWMTWLSSNRVVADVSNAYGRPLDGDGDRDGDPTRSERHRVADHSVTRARGNEHDASA